jgi:peptidyl-prolyl cis-trans isomerase A (cyclophilin A)
MSLISKSRVFAASILLTSIMAFPLAANATIVRVETVLGTFDINLYDNATPATVANFVSYVENGAYTDSIFHRSVSSFIVQSGGFQTDLNAQISGIPANPAVANEPVYSNVRGTIAMAKLGANPDSATNEWFINLVNNGANLDTQNGGFTAFGEVVGNGMDVIDALAALPTFAFASPLGEIPLRNFTATDFANDVAFDNTHLVIVTGISVLDSTVDSAAGLNPTPTTAGETGASTGGGGGGSFGLFALLGLLSVSVKRRIRHV